MVRGNKISFTIEDKTRNVILRRTDQNYTIDFKNIKGLRMKNKYIYHVKIKSDSYYCGYMVNRDDKDMRKLGVMTHIGVEY